MLLGLLSFNHSQFAWYLLSIVMVLWSAAVLWQMYHGNREQHWVAWAVGFLFAPTIYALYFGQVSPLILLGITAFLLLIRPKLGKTDLAAGACLGLLTIKPTLLFLFWLALLFWCIQQRRWLVLLGLFLAVAGGSLVSLLFNLHIFQDYWLFLNSARVVDWGVPTVGSWLRQVWGKDRVALQFIPLAVGAAWFLFHWLRNRASWRWEEQISWLSMLSLITTAFAWTHDQVILLPAVIALASSILSHGRTAVKIGFISAWAIFNLYIFFSHFTRDDSQFVWQAPAILVFFLAGKYIFQPQQAG